VGGGRGPTATSHRPLARRHHPAARGHRAALPVGRGRVARPGRAV